MAKEIKFTSISFNEIDIDGLVYHEYKWDKELKELTHIIDGIEFEKLGEKEARRKITQLISIERKKEPKKIVEVQKIKEISDIQLKLF